MATCCLVKSISNTMMDESFLKKEQEFRKTNEQLEEKNKELMRKVDDILIKKLPDIQRRDFAISNISAKELNLPKSVDEMGPKAMLHFYKTKLKTLQNDFDKTQQQLTQKDEDLKKLEKKYQNLVEEKEKWFLQFNVEKNCNAKLEKQAAATNSKLQLKDSESLGLKKEIEQLKNELKLTGNELNTVENKLKCALQECEKQKNTIKVLRQDEKAAKETYKSHIKDLTSTVKQIQKHKNELLQGYKRQIQLIDNLKRQKSHLESAKILELSETEYLKLLDWKLD